MTMLHAGNELVISGDGKRQIYEDLSNVLALPHARVIAEDGMEVTLPPDAAAVLSTLAVLLASGKPVSVTITEEAEAVRVLLGMLTRLGEEMGGYDAVPTERDTTTG